MQRPSVFVVVLNYNGNDTLNDCLSSVFRSDYPNLNVVVVDNASSDGSFESSKLNFSRAHYIKNFSNIGFAKGNNIGIRFALEKFADYVFILNNDAEIFPNTISILVNAAEKNNKIGIVSPLILGIDKKSIWFAGGKINWLKMSCNHIFTIKSRAIYDSEYASGCAMLVKKNVFKKIGLFDEKFFLYYEDSDFSFKAHKAGFKIMILPEAKVTHKEVSTEKNSRKTYWLVLSALQFFISSAPFMFKAWYVMYVPARMMKSYFSKNHDSNQVREAFKDFWLS